MSAVKMLFPIALGVLIRIRSLQDDVDGLERKG